MAQQLIKFRYLFFLLFFSACTPFGKTQKQKKILVFSATKGYRHESIAAGKNALLKMGTDNKWLVEATEDASLFTNKNLKQYATVLFLNTAGDVLNPMQQEAFEKYIQAGGGFVGIHSATDTEYDWPWYNNLVGAYFESHPEPQEALYTVVNKNHPASSFMPDTLRRKEEIYNFKSFKKDLVTVLITIDETTYTGGKMPAYHPIAWYHNFEGGRAFYTEWGHDAQAYSEPLVLQHIEAAIKWAMRK